MTVEAYHGTAPSVDSAGRAGAVSSTAPGNRAQSAEGFTVSLERESLPIAPVLELSTKAIRVLRASFRRKLVYEFIVRIVIVIAAKQAARAVIKLMRDQCRATNSVHRESALQPLPR